jgi:hypothetical protein
MLKSEGRLGRLEGSFCERSGLGILGTGSVGPGCGRPHATSTVSSPHHLVRRLAAAPTMTSRRSNIGPHLSNRVAVPALTDTDDGGLLHHQRR